MKYAVIQIGSKQLKVSEGESFIIERQKALDMDVLLYSDGKKILVGTPYLGDVKIDANLQDAGFDKKVTVARFKSKSRYRKKKGHKQPISEVTIKSIVGPGEAVDKKPKKRSSTRKSAEATKPKKRVRSRKVKKEE